MSLAAVVHQAVAHGRSDYDTQQNYGLTSHGPKNENEGANAQTPTSNHEQDPPQAPAQKSTPTRITQFRSPPDTPSTRTGPPRSLSFAYSIPGSPPTSRNNSKHENGSAPTSDDLDDTSLSFSQSRSDFRGALEYGGVEADRKGKRRDTRPTDDSWNLKRWFQESPKEEKQEFDLGDHTKANKARSEAGQDNDPLPSQRAPSDDGHGSVTPTAPKSGLRRAFSVPHGAPDGKTGRAKWGRLRSLIPQIIHHDTQSPVTLGGPSVVTSNAVNITDELITGGLSTLMLRLWFERDEKDHRRIPVLFHRLRIRVSDSLHPMQGQKSVFRIECEYANGAARWVVYRTLRDFLSLHTHYTVSNVYNRNVDQMPEFPRTSLPYFKFLKKEGRDVGQADFAGLQREALENYLISLIRAVMFHPSTNRLAGFLEISALSISLAQSGGAQSKAGYLQIEATNGSCFARKSVGWQSKKEFRWCALRESYLVVLEEPGELEVWDVFLLDSEFAIERPKRYYRQGLRILHPDMDAGTASNPPQDPEKLQVHQDSDCRSVIGSIASRVSKIFHIDGSHHTSTAIDRRTSEDTDVTASSGSIASQEHSAMLDPSTNTNPLAGTKEHPNEHPDDARQDNEKKRKKRVTDVSKHTFYIVNAQMRLKLFARNERQMLQWITALEKVAATSHYVGSNRFDSFAPIRLNVAAQWLVDGRDYFWNLSRAILLARECIYIHDWWLSPELQMRRPNKGRYRLDRLLERKAKEGVKIYIILYQEVSNRTTPTDSNYAKQRLLSLHPNVMVQRSPSHFQTGTFYWAHHEKMCVIDQAIAFMGGLDLCFGRWDTPQHVLTDDTDDTERSEIWPGKDYSNPRLSDFYNLNKPEEDMYDRTKVPRMPWHDVAMQVVGQPARDLARHFVQRWNYLLRIKNHTRVMPFLLPPPEFRPGELTQMGLTGTCEMQICRSTGPWSMGTAGSVEHSIQNAYLKAIQMSEHFVYIENQFFITSTVVNDVKVENKIGDALVHRIRRAYRDGTKWKCCIVIPLLPGFTFPVDHSDASAIRIILECQNRTITRGPNSIFARLRKEGIDPDDYISVFSLRNWAKMRGDVLTTEQVYIHGKVCIVDDRLVIIGSANINERSQRGDRDSELAAVIRDTDMIDCTMAGEPFKVGRFAHTLRVRLMREHLGVDVDALDEEDLMANDPVKPEYTEEAWDPDARQAYGKEEGVTHIKRSDQRTAGGNLLKDVLDSANQTVHAAGETTSHTTSKILRKVGLAHNSVSQSAGDDTLDAERKTFTREGKEVPGFTSAIVPTLEEKAVAEQRVPTEQSELSNEKLYQCHRLEEDSQEKEPNGNLVADGGPPQPHTEDGTLFGAPADAARSPQTDDQPPHAVSEPGDPDEEEKAAPGARASVRRHLNTDNWTLPTPKPVVEVGGFEDPVCDAFWKNVWTASAVHNTEIYRKVFHAVPDDLVTTWKQYKEFILHHERLNKQPRDSETPEAVGRVPSESGSQARDSAPHDSVEVPSEDEHRRSKELEESLQNGHSEPRTRRATRGAEPFEKWERDEMEKLLGELCGHLVLYPTRFLEGEDIANNFLFNADRLLPLPIYL